MPTVRHHIVTQTIFAALLFGAHYELNKWYYAHVALHAIAFVLLLGAAIGLILRIYFPRFAFKKSRLLPVVFLLFLMLPWGEWLRLNVFNSREDWSRQLIVSAIFLDIGLLLHSCFPFFFERLFLRLQAFFSNRKASIWLPPFLFFFLAAFVQNAVYHNNSTVQDSASYLFQGKILSSGKLFSPAPPLAEFFSGRLDFIVIKDHRWFSMFTPGLPLILASAIRTGLSGYVMPLFGALTIAIWIAYSLRWFNKTIAFLTGYLLLLSPLLLVLSAIVMTQVVELFICSTVIFLSRLETENASWKSKLALLILLTLGILVRPWSVIVFLTPALLYCSLVLWRKKSFSYSAIILLGTIAGFGMLAFYFLQTTGDPRVPPTLLEMPQLKWGFGINQGGIVHTPLRGLENTSNLFLALNYATSGWYVGSYFFVLIFILFSTRLQTWDKVLIACSLALALFYYCFIMEELLIGPRYYLLMLPVLILLVARSTHLDGESSAYPAALVTTFFLIAVMTALPFRLSTYVQRCNGSGDVSGILRSEIAKLQNHKAVIFIDDQRNYLLSMNDPFLKPPVFCLDLGAKNQELLARFQDYQPLYFRIVSKASKTGIFTAEWKLTPTPEGRSIGYFNMLQFALLLQMQEEDLDIFDKSLSDLFVPGLSAEELRYLDTFANDPADPAYKKSYKQGLIHAARMMLEVQLAAEKPPGHWKDDFDVSAFRNEFNYSLSCFQKSGALGKDIVASFDQVFRRIDKDKDGNLSDPEIENFVSEKIMITQYRINF